MILIFFFLSSLTSAAYGQDLIKLEDLLEEGRSISDYNVKNWGAIGDGETDDYQSLKKAVDLQVPNGNVILYFPAGKYKISQTLRISGAKKGAFRKFKFLIQGSGSANTQLFVTDKNQDTLHIESGSTKEYASGILKNLTLGPERGINDKGFGLSHKKIEHSSMQNISIPGGECNVRTVQSGAGNEISFDPGKTQSGLGRSSCIQLK